MQPPAPAPPAAAGEGSASGAVQQGAVATAIQGLTGISHQSAMSATLGIFLAIIWLLTCGLLDLVILCICFVLLMVCRWAFKDRRAVRKRGQAEAGG